MLNNIELSAAHHRAVHPIHFTLTVTNSPCLGTHMHHVAVLVFAVPVCMYVTSPTYAYDVTYVTFVLILTLTMLFSYTLTSVVARYKPGSNIQTLLS